MASSALVQYVVVRGDLLTKLSWPVGALLAQACHATTAVLHLFYHEEDTQEYLKDLDTMHKVVLEAPDEKTLQSLSNMLSKASIDHKLWVEQPEDFPTCLAVRPYPKAEVQRFFKKLKLYKGPPLAAPVQEKVDTRQ